MRPAMHVAMPSPARERGSMGTKSSPTTSETTSRWPMCSITTTRATGAMRAMATGSITGWFWKLGRPTQAASMTGAKSTRPKNAATT